MSKLKAGRDEPILDSALAIVDTHHHLFDRPGVHYLFNEFCEDINAGHNVVASVFVEAHSMHRQHGPEHLRPVGEIEFANGAGAMSDSGLYGPCRVAAAIVGYADLRLGDRLAETLDRSIAAAPARYRGVRQIAISHPDPAVTRNLGNRPPPDLLEDSRFRAGLRQLAARKLSFDAAVLHHQLPLLGEIVDDNADLPFVLNHIGLALGADMDDGARREVFLDWREKLRDLAKRPNMFCKIGGLGTSYWGLGFDTRPEPQGYLALAEAWKPYVEAGIEAFGVERCMMESNYPPDGRSCGFVPLWNALKYITKGYSAAERNALFSLTGAKFYGIDLSAIPPTRTKSQ